MCPAERRERARLAGKQCERACLFPAKGRELSHSHDLKIPLALQIQFQDIIFEDKIWLAMKFRGINQTNDELAMS